MRPPARVPIVRVARLTCSVVVAAPLARALAIAIVSLVVAIVFAPRVAHAEPPGGNALPLHVLAIDSDDADDQADALTAALRSRVRAMPGWSLGQPDRALGLLTTALRCGARPDAECEKRIADQLKADRFVWGVLAKRPTHQVQVELHMYVRGKADRVVTRVYSDNLKDQNDEALRDVATALVEELTGASTPGTVVLHAGDFDGDVLVDGKETVTLERGEASIELPAGVHTLEVHVSGYPPRTRKVEVGAGKSVAVDIAISKDPEPGPPSPVPVRKIVGWGVVVIGSGFAIAGAVNAVHYFSLQSDLDAERAHNYGLYDTQPAVSDPCKPPLHTGPTDRACKIEKDGTQSSALAWGLGGAGVALVAAGVFLVVTDHPSDDPKPRAVSVVPSVAPGYGGALVSGVF